MTAMKNHANTLKQPQQHVPISGKRSSEFFQGLEVFWGALSSRWNLARNTGIAVLFLFLAPMHAVFGQTTLLSNTLRGGSLPSGWSQNSVTFATPAGGYAKFTATSAVLTTPVFDASAHESVDVATSVAKFGGGGNGPVTIEYSLNGGSTWTVAGNTRTPTSATYLNDTTSIDAVSSTMRIRFTRASSPSQKRLRDVVINGIGTAAPPASAPTVTSGSAGSITTSGATISGNNVTDDGGATVTERGVAYATTTSPDTGDTTVTSAGTTGSYDVDLSGLSAGTLYYARAYAINSEGTSYGSQISFTTVPAAPATPTAASVTTTGFTVNWSAVTGATSYRLDVATDSGFTAFVNGYNNLSVSGTSHAVSGLSPGTTYYVRLRAVSAGGTGASSAPLTQATTGVPEISIESPDSNAIASGGSRDSFGSITLGSSADFAFVVRNSGSASLSVSGISFGGVHSGDFSVVGSSTATIAAGDTATFTIRFAPAVAGARSGTVTFTNNDSDEGSYVINLSGTGSASATAPVVTTAAASPVGSTTATLNGNVNADGGESVTARGFVYSTSDSEPEIGDAGVTQAASGSGTGVFSSNVTGLSADSTYYVQAYAINSVGTSYGGVQSFTTLKGEPSAHAASFTTGTITTENIPLTWSAASPQPDGYLIRVNTSAPADPSDGSTVSDDTNVSGGGAVNLAGDATSYSGFTGFAAGTVYTFKIYPYNNSGSDINYKTDSEPSVTAEVLPGVPGTPSFASVTATGFTASWSAASGADSYRLDVATDDGFASLVSGYNNLTVAGTSRAVSGLAANTVYYARVRAVNTAGTGANSSAGNQTTSQLSAPTTLAASGITSSGFTANWNAVSGATGYRVDVYSEAPGATTTETFTGIGGGTTSSYLTRNWTGDGGISWTAYKARTDQVVDTGNEAIFLQNATGAYLESGEISGGVTAISFDVKQNYSGSGGILTVKVLHGASFATEVTVGTISYTTTKSSFSETVSGVTGAFKIRIDNNTSARPAIDNLAFTGGPTTAFLSGFENADAGAATSLAITGASEGTEYNYVVRATSANSTSANSDVRTVTTTVPDPTISTTGSLTARTSTYGTASATTSFSLIGIDLTEGITVEVPAGFEASTNASSGYGTNFVVGSGGAFTNLVYVRLAAATAAGSYGGDISLSSTGADATTIAIPSSTVNTKTLTVTGLSAATKTYDATTTVTINGTAAFSGLANGDSFTPSGSVTWAFPSANAGTQTLTRTGTYDAPSANYTVTQPTLSGIISPASLTITAVDVSKPVGNTLTGGAGSEAFTSSGLINGETVGTVTITYGAAAGSGATAGVYAGQVTPSAATSGTFTSSNYTITYVSGSITVTESATAPSVASSAAASVSATSATLNGSVSADGGESVTERGFVYSSSDSEPEIGDAGVTKVTSGSDIGSFNETVTGLSPVTLYYFQAYAINSVGTSYGGVESFTTLKAEPANHVTSFAVGTETTANIPVSWTAASPQPDGYLLRVSSSSVANPVDTVSYLDATDVSGGAGAVNLAGNVTSYSDFTGFAAGSTYTFKIFPYNNSGTSIDYKTASAPSVSSELLPDAPDAAPTFANVNAGGFDVNWDAVTGADSYRLDVATDDGFASLVSGYNNLTVAGTSRAVSGLAANTVYYARVRAVNTAGTGANSSAGNQTTSQLSAPTTLAASGITSSGFTANWNAVSGATGYRVDVYSEAPGATTTETFTGIGGGTTSSYLTRNWTGDGGISWTAYKARTDQVVDTGNEAIFLQNATGAYLESGEISGGVTAISFDVKQNYSGSGGILTVKVLHGASFATEVTVGTISYTTTKSSFSETVSGVTGAFKIRIDNNTSARPAIDNLAFTGGPTTAFLSGFENADAGAATSLAITGASEGTEYNYVVRATSANSTSANSDVRTVTTTVPDPTISTTGSLTARTSTYGTASATTSFSLIGIDLTEGITVEVPAGFEASTNASSGYGTNFVVGSGGAFTNLVYVRLAAATAAGSYGGDISLSSTGADATTIAIPSSTVNTKTLTVTGLSAATKTYDATTTVTINGTAAFSGLANGDSFTPSGSVTWAFPSANAGTQTLTRTGTYDAPSANYTVTQPTLSGIISPASLTITAVDVSKPVGNTLTGGAGSEAFTSSGLINGETVGTVTITYGAAAGSGATAGVYAGQVTPSAATSGTFTSSNYTITYVSGSITVTESATAPSVASSAAASVSATSATLNGSVSADGGESVTERGFVYSSSDSEPEIGDAGVTKVTSGSDIGSFNETVTGLSPVTLYYFQAYAINSVGTSYGGVESFTTLKAEPANHVTSFAVGTETTANIPVSWTAASPQPDGYLLRVSSSSVANPVDTVSYLDATDVSGGAGAVNLAGNVTSYSDFTGFAAGSTYTFKIFPYNNSGTSIDYKTASAPSVSSELLPDAPDAAPTFANVNAGGFDVNWDAVTGADSYRLDVATDDGFASLLSGYDNLTVAGTNQTVSGLIPETTYYARVRAVNTAGTGANSPSGSQATSALGAPSTLAATNMTSTSFYANWSAVEGATGYEIDVLQPTSSETSRIIISQYVETDSGGTPKAIELLNVSGETIDFAVDNLVVKIGVNGGSPATVTTVSSGTLAAGEVMVIGTSDVGSYLTSTFGADVVLYVSAGYTFNGNDALVIELDGVVQDAFGNPGSDPGSSWVGNGVSTANQNISLVNGTIDGDTDGWTDPSVRFETVSSNPSGVGGLSGFGEAPFALVSYLETATVIAGGATTTYQVTGLSGSTEYSYIVRATSGGVTSPDSDTRSVTTTDPNPVIGTSGSITGRTTTYGTASSAASFTLTGSEMEEGIAVTMPAGFEGSTNASSGYATSFTVGAAGNFSATVYVRLTAATAAGSYSGDIALSSAGADAATIAIPASTVNPKALTVTGLSAANKTYDGNTTVSVTGTAAFNGLVNGDSFTPSGSVTWAFPNANAGLKTLTRTGTYDAPSANYTVTQPALTATINAKALTITASDVPKVGGQTLTGGPGSTAFTSVGLIGGETIGSVTISYGAGADAGAIVGTYTDSVTPSAATGGSFTPGNYSITYVPGDIIVSGSAIAPVLVTAAASGVSATGATLNGNISGDGGESVTERGFVISATDATPQTGEAGVTTLTSGSGIGVFSATRTGLAPETTYYYQAYAINSVGTSYGGVESFTTPKAEPSAHATSFAAGTITTENIPLTWTAANPQPDGYLLRVSASTVADPTDGIALSDDTDLSNGSGQIDLAGDAAAYSGFSGFVAGTIYTFKLYPYNNSGAQIDYRVASAPSVTAELLPVAPAAAPVATSTNAGGFTLTWEAVNGADNYRLDVATDSGFNTLVVDNLTVAGTSRVVTGLSPETTYYARIRAANTAGSGADSASATITTIVLAAPEALAATSVTRTNFTANWNAVAGATGYEIDVYSESVATATDLLFSEYIEGSSNNKYIEIFNGTGSEVTLSDYEVRLFANGASTASGTQNLGELAGGPSTLASGETLLLRNSSAALSLPVGVTAYASAVANFNGNDALAIWKISSEAYVDIFGRIGNDPGSSWSSGDLSTVNRTLRRKDTVTGGITSNPTGTGSGAFIGLATEWDGYDIDAADGLGSHSLGSAITYVSGYEARDVGNVTSLSVTGLTEGTEYSYRVRAVNGDTASTNSEVITATTASATPPEVPVLATVSAVRTNQFQVNWNNQEIATSYLLDVNTSSNFGGGTVVGAYDAYVVSTNFQLITGLTEGSTYYFRVAARNADGDSDYSSIGEVTLPESLFIQPVALAADPVLTRSFGANWEVAAGATGYRLDVATSDDFAVSSRVVNNRLISDGASTNYTVTGLTRETTYYYRVRAQNAGGTSGNSDVISLTTSNAPPPPKPDPVVPEAPVRDGDGVGLNLGNVSVAGADSYLLQVSTSPDFEAGTIVKQETVSNPAAAVAQFDTTGNRYYVRVVAIAEAGDTPSDPIALIRPTIPQGYSIQAPPVNITNLSFAVGGELGELLAGVLTGGAVANNADQVIVRRDPWRTLWLNNNDNLWYENNEPTSLVLNPGEAYFILRRGAAVTADFLGQVGNGGSSATNALAQGYNLITVSRGQPVSITEAFENNAVSGTPEGGGLRRNPGDRLILQRNGRFETIIRLEDGTWLNTATGQDFTDFELEPGAGFYYYRQGESNLEISF
jgi:hypothetical protein